MWRLKISTCRKPGRNPLLKPDYRPWLLCSLLLSGCLTPAPRTASHWLAQHQLDTTAVNARLLVCQRTGCQSTVWVSLSAAQQQQLRQHFSPAARTPAEERQRIATAIGMMEQLVGPQAQTAHDAAGNVIFSRQPGYQLDCIAETTNSTRYLVLFSQLQLLRWHRPVYPAHRGPLQFTLPHFSAVIEAQHNGKAWAVDSWFHANGQPAEVMPLEQWRRGFSPDRDDQIPSH